MAKKTKARKTQKSQSNSTFFAVDDKNMIYAFVVLALVLVLYWAIKTGAKNYPSGTQTAPVVENTYPAIEDGEGLDKAVAELDKADLNSLDKEMTGLDQEAATF